MPKCVICKLKFQPKYFNQKSCLEPSCVLKYAKIYYQKVQKEKEKNIKVESTKWDVKLQKKVQEIARLIDKRLPCLARNIDNCQIHGGHVNSKGSAHQCKYNLHNIHRQSAHSNKWQNDDYLLRKGIENEYGDNYLRYIEYLKQTPKRKFTQIELHNIYKIACSISNRLKKLNLNYSLIQRIELRNQINIELGIYPSEYCIFSN